MPSSELQVGSPFLSMLGRCLLALTIPSQDPAERLISAPFQAICLLFVTAHDFLSFSSFSLCRGACFTPFVLSGIAGCSGRSAGLSYGVEFLPSVLGLSTQRVPLNCRRSHALSHTTEALLTPSYVSHTFSRKQSKTHGTEPRQLLTAVSLTRTHAHTHVAPSCSAHTWALLTLAGAAQASRGS